MQSTRTRPNMLLLRLELRLRNPRSCYWSLKLRAVASLFRCEQGDAVPRLLCSSLCSRRVVLLLPLRRPEPACRFKVNTTSVWRTLWGVDWSVKSMWQVVPGEARPQTNTNTLPMLEANVEPSRVATTRVKIRHVFFLHLVWFDTRNYRRGSSRPQQTKSKTERKLPLPPSLHYKEKKLKFRENFWE